MKKELVVILVLILFSFQLVSALDINIKTLSGHKYDYRIVEAGKLKSLESKANQDTGTGEISFDCDIEVMEIDLFLTLKKDGTRIINNKKFEGVSTEAGIININLIPGEIELITGIVEEIVLEENITEEVVNESEVEIKEENENEIVEEEIQEDEGLLTGAVIGKIKNLSNSKTIYYIIEGVFIIGVFILIVFIIRKKIKKERNFKVTKLSDRGSLKDEDYEQKLENAERKINEAKEELDFLRDRKRKLGEAREKFKKDQEELKKLEGDY